MNKGEFLGVQGRILRYWIIEVYGQKQLSILEIEIVTPDPVVSDLKFLINKVSKRGENNKLEIFMPKAGLKHLESEANSPTCKKT